MEIYSNHHNFQTVRARDLKFWHNVHCPQCVMCHMSHVTCHVSRVTCHVSHVTCHMSRVTCKKKQNKKTFFLWLSGGASRWRVCYQRGRPRLVLTTNRKYPQLGIISPIGDIKSPVEDNIPKWGLGISVSGKAESQNKSPISNRIKYPQFGIQNNPFVLLYLIGYFLLLVL